MTVDQRPDVLNITSILRILPQKPPAILIDRVLEVSPGVRIMAAKNVSASDPVFAGHFPGLPLLPGSSILEALVQTCCLLAYATERFDPISDIVMLIGVNKMKFYRMVGPGDTLEIEGRLESRRSNVWRFETNVFIGDRRIAEGGIVLSLQKREDLL